MAYPSAVAGIVNSKGEVARVVVTQPWLFHHHVKPGERLFIIPGLRVREPLSIGQAIPVIEAVKQYVESSK